MKKLQMSIVAGLLSIAVCSTVFAGTGTQKNQTEDSILGTYYYYSGYSDVDGTTKVNPDKSAQLKITKENGAYYADDGDMKETVVLTVNEHYESEDTDDFPWPYYMLSLQDQDTLLWGFEGGSSLFKRLQSNTAVSAANESGWNQDELGWKYLNTDGSYKTNTWFKDTDGRWYFFNNDGYILTNTWSGNYYLGHDGAMLTDTVTPDGYKVDKNGAWISEKSGAYDKYIGRKFGEYYSVDNIDKSTTDEGAKFRYIVITSMTDNELKVTSYSDEDNKSVSSETVYTKENGVYQHVTDNILGHSVKTIIFVNDSEIDIRDKNQGTIYTTYDSTTKYVAE